MFNSNSIVPSYLSLCDCFRFLLMGKLVYFCTYSFTQLKLNIYLFLTSVTITDLPSFF